MKVTSKLNASAQVRLLHAQGLTLHQVADQMNMKPTDVRRAIERRARMGKPGGNMSLEDQIRFARRILESAQGRAIEQAQCLLETLLTQACTDTGAKIRQAGG